MDFQYNKDQILKIKPELGTVAGTNNGQLVYKPADKNENKTIPRQWSSTVQPGQDIMVLWAHNSDKKMPFLLYNNETNQYHWSIARDDLSKMGVNTWGALSTILAFPGRLVSFIKNLLDLSIYLALFAVGFIMLAPALASANVLATPIVPVLKLVGLYSPHVSAVMGSLIAFGGYFLISIIIMAIKGYQQKKLYKRFTDHAEQLGQKSNSIYQDMKNK